MTKYSKAFKERVVRKHQPGVHGGFRTLAKRFKISSSVIRGWWKQWRNGGQTMEAFESIGGDRRSIQTQREKERYTKKKNVSLRTVQEIGKDELNLSWKKTTQSLVSDGQYA